MSTMADPIDIEEEENLVFDPAKWIQQGKRYKGAPLHVQNACMAVTRVPEAVVALLPDDDLTILDFISLALPTQSAAINFFPDQRWFDLEEPTISGPNAVRNVLWKRTVPPKSTILKLEATVGQKWLDGCKSITDPRFDHGKIRLPLWTLKLWRALGDILDKRRDWEEAVTFVGGAIAGNPDWGFPAEGVFKLRGWNTQNRYDGFTFSTSLFTQLLSTAWLCDEMTQVMVRSLQKRLDANPDQHPHHSIAASRFYLSLRSAAARNRYTDKNIPASLSQAEKIARNDPQLQLWFPVLHSNHEVAMKIDFGQKTYGYGMIFMSSYF
jgi:hypothetical protein